MKTKNSKSGDRNNHCRVNHSFSITEFVVQLNDLRKSVRDLSNQIMANGEELTEYIKISDSTNTNDNNQSFDVSTICTNGNKQSFNVPHKIVFVLGTRYDPNYGSIFNSQNNGVASTIFRDSIRIEMLAEILGDEYCVKSMNDLVGDNEFHISACFGKRAANCESISEYKNVKLHLHIDLN
jgi:hypothetical protein